MKRIIYRWFPLFVCVLAFVLGGCHSQKAGGQATEPPTTLTQASTVGYSEEAAELFSFVVPGKTTIQEVVEKIPYESDGLLAVNYMFVCYHLSDGVDALVYFDSQTSLVTGIVLEFPDGSRTTLTDGQ